LSFGLSLDSLNAETGKMVRKRPVASSFVRTSPGMATTVGRGQSGPLLRKASTVAAKHHLVAASPCLAYRLGNSILDHSSGFAHLRYHISIVIEIQKGQPLLCIRLLPATRSTFRSFSSRCSASCCRHKMKHDARMMPGELIVTA
jgi:hypothetical protein